MRHFVIIGAFTGLCNVNFPAVFWSPSISALFLDTGTMSRLFFRGYSVVNKTDYKEPGPVYVTNIGSYRRESWVPGYPNTTIRSTKWYMIGIS
jgi:hypothetical protein